MELKKHKLPKHRKWSRTLSRHLCEEHADEFNEWWNPELFNWEGESNALAKYCHEHFEKWWDPNRLKTTACILAKYCSEYFDKWWDYFKHTVELSDDVIWPLFCPQHFRTWWPVISKRYRLTNSFWIHLADNCVEYIDEWIMHFLEQYELTKAILSLDEYDLIRLLSAAKQD